MPLWQGGQTDFEFGVRHQQQHPEFERGGSVELQDLGPSTQTGGTPFPEQRPSSDPIQHLGGVFASLYKRMMTALLRASPAAGASSYGALPTLPLRPGYASSIDGSINSDMEETGNGIDGMYGHNSPREEQDDESLMGGNPQPRKRTHLVREMLGTSRFHPVSEGGGGEGANVRMVRGMHEEESDNEEIDEADPPDNSP